MPYAARIILHTPISDSTALARFVEDCLADEVVLIAVIGRDASVVEDQIDDLIIRDGSDGSRFIVTTAHAEETIEAVRAFVTLFDAAEGTTIQEVNL